MQQLRITGNTVKFWVMSIPLLTFTSIFAAFNILRLKELPRLAVIVIVLFGITQVLPSFLTPEPLLNVGLAIVRLILIIGLIGTGLLIDWTENLWFLSLGLIFLQTISLIYTLSENADLFNVRLIHPFMTTTAVGLSGAFGLWIGLFGRNFKTVKFVLIAWSFFALVFSGSRTAILSAVVPILIVFIINNLRIVYIRLIIIVVAFVIPPLLVSTKIIQSDTFARLIQPSVSGRDIVWYDTYTVVRKFFWSGVGSYRLGKYISQPEQVCGTFTNADGSLQSCPQIIRKLGNPWVIAHSGLLQQFAETGFLGVFGLLGFLTIIISVALQQDNRLLMCIVIGSVIANIQDNTLIVPSSYHAELFWLTVGTILKDIGRFDVKWRPLVIAAAAMSTWLLPLVYLSFWSTGGRFGGKRGQLDFIYAPRVANLEFPYKVIARIILPSGMYRAVLSSCYLGCVSIRQIEFKSEGVNNTVQFNEFLSKVPDQQLQLRILLVNANKSTEAVNFFQWRVRSL